MAAKVLIVDDDPKVLNFVDRALSSKGYHTEATSSPRKALEIVKRTRPCFDLLLTDVVMPEMCGPELAKKAACICSSIAVVLMSGCVLNANIPPQAIFIAKPFLLKDLLVVVERSLERSREARNNLSATREKNAELKAQSERLMGDIDEVGRAIDESVRSLKEKLGRDRDRDP